MSELNASQSFMQVFNFGKDRKKGGISTEINANPMSQIRKCRKDGNVMKKKVLALTIALTLIFSFSFPASAITYTNGTWLIQHSNSNIYGEIKAPSCVSTLAATSSRSGVISTCISYYFQTNSSGSTAYARVDAYWIDINGETHSLFNGDHRISQSTLSKSTSISSGGRVTATYTVNGALPQLLTVSPAL